MRSTLDIIIAVKECQLATEEELRLALVAMSAIEHFVRRDLRSLIEAVEEGKPSMRMRAKFAKDNLDRWFKAKKMPPGVYLGPSGTPGNPEHDRHYRIGLGILDKVTSDEAAPTPEGE